MYLFWQLGSHVKGKKICFFTVSSSSSWGFSLINEMEENNIETGIHYFPIHKMKLYNSKLKLKITEETSEKLVSLPIHPNLTDSDVKRVIKLTNQFSKN